jgi:hypothetical protein
MSMLFFFFFLSPPRPQPPEDSSTVITVLDYDNLFFPFAILAMGCISSVVLVGVEKASPFSILYAFRK